MFSKRLLGGVALGALSAFASGTAHAQSTGSQAQEQETIVVTGARNHTIGGALTAESVGKSRSTITAEYIGHQNAGQTVLQDINNVPGVNFTNSDPYGNSGGNIRIRGFDGNRISLTFDGTPLNDSGNYAIFSNQLLDPELITRASVNMGTTDVDSPTASATGGTVNFVTRQPLAERTLMLQGSLGDFNYRRIIGVLDTGEFGPWDTTAFGAVSYTNYDKWKGPGELEKWQENFRLYQNIGDNGDFLSLAVHYNRNRNNFYRNITQAVFNTAPDTENDLQCIRLTPGAGAQNETTGDTIVRWDGTTQVGTSCTNYYNVRVNPSNTGNIRGAASFHLTDNLRLTIDPSFQYVLANGGGFSTVSEKDDRLDLAGGNAGGPGVDLNGDGDTLDTVALYSPNTTNTRRYGLTSSLIWDLDDSQRLRFAYTMDYARHRQTGDFTFLDPNGNPLDVFGGKDGYGPKVNGLSGDLRTRERFSIALLNQFALEYRGFFLDDHLTVNAGLRVPLFERELNQQCYSQNGSSNVRCTNEPATPGGLPGNVQLSGSTVTNGYLPPYHARLTYNSVLPNLGLTYRLGDRSSLYVSYAEGFSAPRTDNLYTVSRGSTPTSINFSNARPEKTRAYDLGYRYQSSDVIGSIAVWRNDYNNRIVNSFDPDLGFFVDRNVGQVILSGVDVQLGWQITPSFSVVGMASWTNSELQNNIPLGSSPTNVLLTRGKELVETPENTLGIRADWDVTHYFSVGVQGHYVGERYATDVNDESVPSYTTWDLDARLDLSFLNLHNSYLQLNVTNIADERYLGSISSQTNALPIADTDPGTPGLQGRSGTSPTYGLGAPRAAMVTLRTTF